jgi:hypothetical protein
MISELPKLFDKNFAISYFLPSAGFVVTADFVFSKLAKTEPLVNFAKESLLSDLTAFGIASLITAVGLSILTRHVVRFMEGYWTFTIFRREIDLRPYFTRFEHEYFDRLTARREELRAKRQNNTITADEKHELSDVAARIAERFPVRKDLLLPTSFGNTYRAFETYAKEMYGIEAIDGWFRLMAIIPKDYLSLMNDARARMDFGVNLWFLTLVLLAEYIAVAAVYIRVPGWQSFFTRETLWWFPPVMVVLACLSYVFARNAVGLWGNWIKSAFDLYLPELRKKMEFKLPGTAADEVNMWKKFNEAIVFRRPDRLPEKERKPAETPPGAGSSPPKSGIVEQLLVINIALKLLQEDLNSALKSLENDAAIKPPDKAEDSQ